MSLQFFNWSNPILKIQHWYNFRTQRLPISADDKAKNTWICISPSWYLNIKGWNFQLMDTGTVNYMGFATKAPELITIFIHLSSQSAINSGVLGPSLHHCNLTDVTEHQRKNSAQSSAVLSVPHNPLKVEPTAPLWYIQYIKGWGEILIHLLCRPKGLSRNDVYRDDLQENLFKIFVWQTHYFLLILIKYHQKQNSKQLHQKKIVYYK